MFNDLLQQFVNTKYLVEGRDIKTLDSRVGGVGIAGIPKGPGGAAAHVGCCEGVY